ncbi:N-formylglutamate amidohydrolase [Rhodoligotrophos ferricapiens]|uniref:N-formylglutamate amidohydrolase n=1 Tax=Rhodoligotrophos ferricapiens TaxID=3069264 RepID=UPI00315D9581
MLDDLMAVSAPGSSEPIPPFIEIEGNRRLGLLLICDHARNSLPESYGSLGLPPSELKRHIAYDIGAEALTRALAARLSAPAVLSTFSRLLIDPNRGEDDPTLIMQLSDGAVIPGNARIDQTERRARIELFYRPYHDAIARGIQAITAAGRAPVVISVHSFTPNWKGVPRPWHVGLLWGRDDRLSRALVAALRAEPAGLVVGENEPYSGALAGDTIDTHCIRNGLSHTLIEIRQDLISDNDGVAQWADRLESVLRRVLSDSAITERISR